MENEYIPTDTWNIAKGFVNLKILLPLVECDKLEKIALYGTEHIEETLSLTPQLKIILRKEALERLLDTIKIIIENTLQLIKKLGKKQIEIINKRLTLLESKFDTLLKKQTNNVTKKSEYIINEYHFRTCLNILRSIKSELTGILNESNLIFPSNDETDLENIKNILKESG